MIPKAFGLETVGNPGRVKIGEPIERVAGPVGIPTGTCIWTRDGALPIEYLVPGDRVVTRDGGLASLQAITSHDALTRMVRIGQNALGVGRPGLSVDLPAAQPVLIRGDLARMHGGDDSLFVPAQSLVDWRIATDLGRQSRKLFSPAPLRAHILYCNGLEIGVFPKTSAR